MYYTHGDTVIYRSDTPKRNPQRFEQRERPAEKEPRPAEPSTRQVLTARIYQLEERLARLEADLEEARQASVQPAPRKGGGPRQGQGGEVKVSLHAEGGTQATVGQVRMVSQD